MSVKKPKPILDAMHILMSMQLIHLRHSKIHLLHLPPLLRPNVNPFTKNQIKNMIASIESKSLRIEPQNNTLKTDKKGPYQLTLVKSVVFE